MTKGCTKDNGELKTTSNEMIFAQNNFPNPNELPPNGLSIHHCYCYAHHYINITTLETNTYILQMT
jgi:hypothetical protein